MSAKSPSYRYRVTVIRVVDGDTLLCDVDLGFYTRIRTKLRLAGVNCPELDTAEGKAARDYVAHALGGSAGVWTADTVRADKYGNRWDAVVYLPDGRSLNDLLVESGYAVRVAADAKRRGDTP